MSYDKLLNCTYQIKDNIIICPEEDITLNILNKDDNNIVLQSSLSNVKKLFKLNAKIAKEFNTISNEAFKKEISFTLNSTIKRITEYDLDTDISEIGRTDNIIFTYNIQNDEFVASLFYGDKMVDDEIMSIYIYALFSNYKYRRQDHCYNMIQLLSRKKSETYNRFIMISTIYVWNTASIKLYEKLGFTINEYQLSDDIDELMAKKNIKELKYVCDYNGDKLNEAHYFILTRFVSTLDFDFDIKL